MLETFYNSFGFLGSISIAFLIILCFIFWLAGVAGISQMSNSTIKYLKLVVAIVFPPYPIIWVFVDMFKQRRLMKEKQIN